MASSEQRVKPELLKYPSARIQAGESKLDRRLQRARGNLTSSPRRHACPGLHSEFGARHLPWSSSATSIAVTLLSASGVPDPRGAAGQLGWPGRWRPAGKVDEALAATWPSMIGQVPIAGTPPRLMILRNLRAVLPRDMRVAGGLEQVLAKAAEAMLDSNGRSPFCCRGKHRVAQGKVDLARDLVGEGPGSATRPGRALDFAGRAA